MEELHNALKEVLANTFTMYFKAHAYHWNVTGSDFVQMHGFFGDLYGELHGAVDPIAEHIRAVNGFAPTSLSRIQDLASIDETDNIPDAAKMVRNLLADNDEVLVSLKGAYNAANSAGEDGLANFIQDRMDIHKKHGWMLRAIAGIKP